MSDEEELLLAGLHGVVDAGGPATISSSSSLDSFAVMDLAPPPAPGSGGGADAEANGSSTTSGSDEVDSSAAGSSEPLLSTSANLVFHSNSYSNNNSQEAHYALHPVSQRQLPLASDLASMLQSTSLPTLSSPGHPYGTAAPAVGGAVPAAPGSPGLASAGGGGGGGAAAAATQNSTPEFLYQLTKMLTDHDNREIIEWSGGRIEVHSPHKLETHVLGKYFRHSKFASFQRQLNYFGFRKLAGKGKMAPCSYVNEAAAPDVGSLLSIKRKVPLIPSTKERTPKSKAGGGPRGSGASEPLVNPILAGILQRNMGAAVAGGRGRSFSGHVVVAPAAAPVPPSPPTKIAKPHPSATPQELARAAAGRGIRHSLAGAAASTGAASPAAEPAAAIRQGEPDGATRALQAATAASSFALPMSASLSQLELNYRNSINEMAENRLFAEAEPTPLNEMLVAAPRYGFLSRDSSLIDLAMIPPVDGDGDAPRTSHSIGGFGLGFDFLDPDPVDQKPAAAPSSERQSQPHRREGKEDQPLGADPC